MHLFTYRNIGIFSHITTNQSLQLFIVSTLFESLVLLYFVLMQKHSLFIRRYKKVLLFCLTVLAVFFTGIYIWGHMPAFVEGDMDTTSLKSALQLLTAGILAAAAYFLYTQRNRMKHQIVRLLLYSLILKYPSARESF
jgi:hypothetical protein